MNQENNNTLINNNINRTNFHEEIITSYQEILDYHDGDDLVEEFFNDDNMLNFSELSREYTRHGNRVDLLENEKYYKQIAMQKYESLDQDSSINQSELKFIQDTNYDQEIRFQISLVLIGITMGIFGYILDRAQVYLQEIRSFNFEQQQDVDRLLANLIYISISLGQGLIACIPILLYFKSAAGGGIAEIKSYLNGVNISNLTTLETGLSKLILTIFSVSSGLFVGLEAPMIHVGAAVGAAQANMPFVDQIFPTSHWQQLFRDDHSRRDMLSCGAAAGVVAGFMSPLGGFMFAVEEASTYWNVKMTIRTFFVSMVTATTIQLFTGLATGNFFISRMVKFESFTSHDIFSMEEFPIFALIGILTGVIGGVFNLLAKSLMQYRFKMILNNTWLRFWEIVLILLVTASVRVYIPQLLHSCHPVEEQQQCSTDSMAKLTALNPDQTIAEFIQTNCTPQNFWKNLGCNDDQYNPIFTLLNTKQQDTFQSLFHSKEAYGLFNLLSCFVISFILVLLLIDTAVPMGLFMPCMQIGATFGRLICESVRSLQQVQGYYNLNPGMQALLGAAGVTTGITSLMVTVIVVFQEGTNRSDTCIPLMIVVIISKLVSQQFSRGIQENMIDIRAIPYVHSYFRSNKLFVSASDIMTKNVSCLHQVESVKNIISMLSNTSHNAFPIIDNNDQTFDGLIRRNELVVLLSNSSWFKVQGEEFDSKHAIKQIEDNKIEPNLLSHQEFCKNQENKVLKLNEENLRQITDEQWIDLRPQIDRGALSLNLFTAVQKIIKLFKNIGVRHLIVSDKHNKVKGIITRKDLINKDSHI